MRSTVIRGSAVLSMALLLLVSCSSGGEKKEGGKVKSVGTSARSAPTGTNTVSAAPHKKMAIKKASAPKGASSPQKEKDIDYNGVTQFNVK